MTYPAPGQPTSTEAPSLSDEPTVVEKSDEDLRVATLHADLVADSDTGGAAADQLVSALGTGNHVQARMIARTVQMNSPDVLALTGVTYDSAEMIAEHLRSLYFSSGQDGLPGVEYPHVFTAPTNSGKDAGADLDGDGFIGGSGDTIGHGEYPGQYGMIVFSKHPIVEDEVRTFQNFLWRDLPGGSMPQGYSELEESVMRLQDSSLWDVPIDVPGKSSPVHIVTTSLASQQAPDAEPARAEDIRRVVRDYVSGASWYLTDDDGGHGGLTPGTPFVVTGAPVAAEADEGISQLLKTSQMQDPEPEAVTEQPVSQRPGASQQADATATRHVPQEQDRRASLVLPAAELEVSDSGVFWPGQGEFGYAAVDPSSSYSLRDRLVWVDLSTGG